MNLLHRVIGIARCVIPVCVAAGAAADLHAQIAWNTVQTHGYAIVSWAVNSAREVDQSFLFDSGPFGFRFDSPPSSSVQDPLRDSVPALHNEAAMDVRTVTTATGVTLRVQPVAFTQTFLAHYGAGPSFAIDLFASFQVTMPVTVRLSEMQAEEMLRSPANQYSNWSMSIEGDGLRLATYQSDPRYSTGPRELTLVPGNVYQYHVSMMRYFTVSNRIGPLPPDPIGVSYRGDFSFELAVVPTPSSITLPVLAGVLCTRRRR